MSTRPKLGAIPKGPLDSFAVATFLLGREEVRQANWPTVNRTGVDKPNFISITRRDEPKLTDITFPFAVDPTQGAAVETSGNTFDDVDRYPPDKRADMPHAPLRAEEALRYCQPWTPSVGDVNSFVANEDDTHFLERMNAKMSDPTKPLFTLDEVTRCYTIVLGEPAEGNEAFIKEYCLPHMNTERNELCFFK